jgi:predicted site-specific integrase-resolvase
MPVKLKGETYYWTAEACKIAGISKNTFLRWVREGIFIDVRRKDRRGWRLFNEQDLSRLKGEVNRVNKITAASNDDGITTHLS